MEIKVQPKRIYHETNTGMEIAPRFMTNHRLHDRKSCTNQSLISANDQHGILCMDIVASVKSSNGIKFVTRSKALVITNGLSFSFFSFFFCIDRFENWLDKTLGIRRERF